MPRKLFARMELEDRDPDGFKFPSNKNNNRSNSSKPKQKNHEHNKNKMRGGIQFVRGNVAEEDEKKQKAEFKEWMRSAYGEESVTSEGLGEAILEHVFGLDKWNNSMLDEEEKFRLKKKEFQKLGKDMGIKSIEEKERLEKKNWRICEKRDNEARSKESGDVDDEPSSSSPLIDIPAHVRDLILKKVGVRTAAAVACTCKELRDDVKEQRKRATGNFKLRSSDVRGEEDVRYILLAYPNVTGVTVDKLNHHRPPLERLDYTERLSPRKRTLKMMKEILVFTHSHKNVSRLGFTNSGLDFSDFLRILCESARECHSFDFSGNNTGEEIGETTSGIGFRPSALLDYMVRKEIFRRVEESSLQCVPPSFNPFVQLLCQKFAYGKSIKDEMRKMWTEFLERRGIPMPIWVPKPVVELNVSNCGLKHYFDLFFYMAAFRWLKRLDASRNSELNINYPESWMLEDNPSHYHSYDDGDEYGHVGEDCSVEYLNLSGSATTRILFSPNMQFNPCASFKKLKELNLSASKSLKFVNLTYLPSLEVLNLVNCKELHTLKLYYLPSLHTLSLDICKKLENIVYQSSEIHSDDVIFEALSSIESKIESLRKLSMNQCDALSENVHRQLLQSAVNLEHYRCEGLHSESMREVRIPSTSLVSVEMSGCKQIQCILLNSPNLKLLRARNCRYLKDIRVNAKRQHAAGVGTMVEIDVRNSAKLVSVTGLRVDRSTRILSGGATSLERIQSVD
jgi:hypothetical protein